MTHDRPHPLCSDCGYDLVGSVRGGGRVCPECGCDYTIGQLARALQQNWTPAIGYRRAVTSLVIKSLIILPVCTGLLWLVTPALAASRYWGVVLVLAIAGFVLGYIACLNLVERTGLASPMLGLVAAAFIWLDVLAAAGISHFAFRPLPDLSALYAQMTVAIFASIWILKEVILDP
jgi:hypothetical protein